MEGFDMGCGVAVVQSDELRHTNSHRVAMAGRKRECPMRWVLALATDEHKLDDREQFFEIDGLADHFLGA